MMAAVALPAVALLGMAMVFAGLGPEKVCAIGKDIHDSGLRQQLPSFGF